jgi:hypothetical protein
MSRIRRILIFAAITIVGCSALLFTKIKFDFREDVDGFFILEGEKGAWLELTDDLTPEDAYRLIWGMPVNLFKSVSEGNSCKAANTTGSCLDYRWNRKEGRGFIRNKWPDGSKLVINLGRFRESNGKYPSGLFIGGGLPPSDPDYRFLNNEATGMTYFNGLRWFHVWCNVNEGIISPSSPFIPSYPADWKYKESWVLEDDGTHLTILSRHSLILNGEPLNMDRTLFYMSGQKYVIMVTEITNVGTKPSTMVYMYGDEPWVGDYGSSAGDVGWSEKGLLFTEHEVNAERESFIGMFDYGNPLAGEAHNFTGIANFIEWKKDEYPDKAYVSNLSGGVMGGPKPAPLTSKGNRFIGLQWGPHTLNPGESLHFSIAVGMAENDPKSGMPVKPETVLNH